MMSVSGPLLLACHTALQIPLLPRDQPPGTGQPPGAYPTLLLSYWTSGRESLSRGLENTPEALGSSPASHSLLTSGLMRP